MTVAIHPLDPIAAAKADIEGSKSLMAAVADDLSQHERWLAHYRLAEKRHARRVMLQELLYQLDLARKRTMRFLRWVALHSLRLARHVATVTARTATLIFVSTRDAIIACFDWLRPRAIALALLLRRWLLASWVWLAAQSRAFAALVARWSSATWVWLAAQSRALAAFVARWSSAAWAWTRANAAILARVSLKGVSIASTWIATTSLALAEALLHWLARTWRRTRALFRVLTRKSLYGAAVASAWIAATSRDWASELRQRFAAARKWTFVHGRIVARASLAGARRASSWSAATSHAAWKWSFVNGRIAGRASLAGARRASSWSAATSQAAAVILKRNLSEGAAWSSAKTARAGDVTARATIAAASRMSHSWAMLTTRRASNGLFQEEPPALGQTHRALVVRRSTAIICFEPRRSGLPTFRAG